ncbi:MAG: deoxyribose-phosphate aldolase [Bacteroidales bacterium]|nr:deoxyribose-phosphate aldolase [Clostridium sp.]MCM1204326.1 deoxyribose-phosphate aldolase [Bacteroidales bacterium]
MEFCKYFDHTLLRADAGRDEVDNICREAIRYRFASVCVNSAWIREASALLADTDIGVCTVVGFPLGAMSTMAKKLEALTAIEDGATEIDMVVNLGAVKDADWEYVRKDIEEVKEVCTNNTMGREVILKVIIEACLLSEEEKIKVCEAAVEAGADFVKTSTGFSTGGAVAEDVALMRKTVDAKTTAMEKETGITRKRVRVKASGGIRNLAAARAMLDAGADRLGTSATVEIISEAKNT